MSVQLQTAQPTFGVLVYERNPIILLDTKADAAHKIRLKYLSLVTATQADGVTERTAIASLTDIPDIPREFRELLLTLIIAKTAEELASVVNTENGNPLFPAMMQVAQTYRQRYEVELERKKTQARRRPISRQQAPFQFSEMERSTGYSYENYR